MIDVNLKEYIHDVQPLFWGFVVSVFFIILVEIVSDEIKRHKENH